MFATASAAAALIAASAVARQEDSVDAGAVLRPVLVAARPLYAGARIEAVDLEVRRFPTDYVPAEVLADPAGAIGARSSVRVPAGAYVMPSLFGAEGPSAQERSRRAALGRRTPVELGIAGAGALRGLTGRRVDVLVTRDSARGLDGRTRPEVQDAHLAGLARGSGDIEWIATLLVGRSDALRLIEADTYARELRLIASSR